VLYKAITVYALQLREAVEITIHKDIHSINTDQIYKMIHWNPMDIQRMTRALKSTPESSLSVRDDVTHEHDVSS